MQIFTNPEIKTKFYTDFVDYFSQKLHDLWTRKQSPSSKNLISLLSNARELALENELFDKAIVELCSDQSRKNLAFVIEALDFLDGAKKEELVISLLQNLKNGTAKISSLKLNQIAKIMIEVLETHPSQITPFFKYLEKTLNSNFKDEFEISVFTDLMHALVKHGFIEAEQKPTIYYHYVNDMCAKYEQLPADEYIKALWVLSYTEEADLDNPLIPIMFEKLPQLELTRPLTDLEAAYFHQIMLFVDMKIKQMKFPESYRDLIPESVQKVAKQKYIEMDQNLHADFRKEIGEILLKGKIIQV
jgi:hypothetical protein